MLEFSDVCLILGNKNSGKTILAKKLAQSLQFDYIYINYNFVSNEYLNELYQNKDKKSHQVIIFDNYYINSYNKKIDKLFLNNENFTLIYVMNHINLKVIKFTDIIFIAKENCDDQLNHIYNRINKYFKNLSFEWMENKMEELSEFGFLGLHKDNCFDIDEVYL